MNRIRLLVILFFVTSINYTYSQGSLSKGLVAYYKFDGNANDDVGGHDGNVLGAEIQSGMRCGQHQRCRWHCSTPRHLSLKSTT